MILFVIDGIDCSGKQTVSRILTEKIKNNITEKVKNISFPDYDRPSGQCVRSYLNGDYIDDENERLPILYSTLYAIDRGLFFRSKCDDGRSMLQKLNDDYRFIIADRYTTSNFIHQGARLLENVNSEYEASQLLREYVYKMEDIEHNLYSVPRATHTFILNTDIKTIIDRISNRNNNKHGSSKDIHESDNKHLRNAYSAIQHFKEYNILRNTTFIDCGDKSSAEIADVIFKNITRGV